MMIHPHTQPHKDSAYAGAVAKSKLQPPPDGEAAATASEAEVEMETQPHRIQKTFYQLVCAGAVNSQ